MQPHNFVDLRISSDGALEVDIIALRNIGGVQIRAKSQIHHGRIWGKIISGTLIPWHSIYLVA